MTTPITPLPTPPNRSTDTPSEFANKADAFASAQVTFGDEVNVVGAEMEILASSADASAFAAEASSDNSSASASASSLSADIAASNANYVGLWSNRTGPANVPYSVTNNGKQWRLLVDIADVEASEPGVSSDWSEILSSRVTTASQLDYSSDATVPDDFVVSLNPLSAGLTATLSTTDIGDIKRLVNISAFETTVRLTGTGFLTLPAGDTAYLMRVGADWYVTKNANEVLPSTTYSFGTGEVAYNPAVPTRDRSLTMLSATSICVINRDAVTGHGYATVGTISGSYVTFGTSVSFNAASTDYISVCALSSSKVLIAYQTAGSQGTAKIGDITGSSIAFNGISYNFNGASSSRDTSVEALDSTNVVLSYADGGDANHGKSVVAQVSGTVITYGSEYEFNDSTSTDFDVTILSPTKFVVCYRDDGVSMRGTARIGDITGTVITFGSEYVFNGTTSTTIVSSPLSAPYFAISFIDVSAGSYGTSIVGSYSGNTISFGTKAPYIESNLNENTTMTSNGVDKINIIYKKTGGITRGTVVTGTVTGLVVDFTDPYTFTGDFFNSPSSGHIQGTDKFIVLYRDDFTDDIITTIGEEVTA